MEQNNVNQEKTDGGLDDKREVVKLTRGDVDSSYDVDFGSVRVVNYAGSTVSEIGPVLVRADATRVFDEVILGTIATIASLMGRLESVRVDNLNAHIVCGEE